MKPFIGNHTREIKNLFPVSLWSHCPTNDNPADLLTRGISAREFHASTLWKHGPHWLPSESQWPSWNSSQVLHIHTPEAIAAEATTDETTQTEPTEETAGIHCIMDVSRYNTLAKLLTVTAYVLRFVKNRESRQVRPLSAKERQQACNRWIQNCQGLTYVCQKTTPNMCYLLKLEGAAFRAPAPTPLPKLRVQETAPFAVTGEDFTGPLYVRSEGNETKCYICLFTCAVTRAVHLKVVSDLTEKSFLQAFRRFKRPLVPTVPHDL